MTAAWDDSWGHARPAAPAAPRACTTCGISAPAHDEAIAVGVVRAHAWTGPTGTTGKEERP